MSIQSVEHHESSTETLSSPVARRSPLAHALTALATVFVAGAAGLGAVTLKDDAASRTTDTGTVRAPVVVVPRANAREGRTPKITLPACPPLLDGHPPQQVRRTWVCPKG